MPDRNGDVVKLWVDDIRRPPDESWWWARTNDEAREFLKSAIVVEVSLDHDMGHHDRDPDDEDSIFLRGDSEDDGRALARWMVEHGKVPPVITVHSWNPVGARAIAEILQPHCSNSVVIMPYEVRR